MMDGLSSLFSSFADLLNPIVEFIIWAFPIKVYRLHDGEHGVILTFGRTRTWRHHDKGPGIAICFACETMKRGQVLGKYSDMPEQVLYSKDGYAMQTNLAVIYEITDATTAFLKTEHLEAMVEGTVMDYARDYSRTHKMVDIVQRKDIGKAVIKDTNEELKKWGVQITDLIITDLRPHNIMLIGEMLDKMNRTGFHVRVDSGVRPPTE